MDAVIWIFILTCIRMFDCFNIDIKEAVIYRGKTGSSFGASTELLGNQNKKWLLVGAPKDNFTDMPQIIKPGNVYKCPIDTSVRNGTGCEALHIRTAENTDSPDAPGVYEQTTQLLGSSILIGKKSVVTCAHLWKSLRVFASIGAYSPIGHCHEITPDLSRITPKVFRITNDELNKNRLPYYSAAGFGFSTAGTDNPVFSVLLGHPNTYDGSGGFSYYIEEIDYPFFEKYSVYDSKDLSDIFLAGSYLGYSVASGIFGTVPSIKPQVVLGAPGFTNEKGTIGSVVLVELTPASTIRMLKQMTGSEQIGSGFGQSVCVADVSGDNIHDILVGAPLESDQKVEMGAVYVYLGTKDSNYINDSPGTVQVLRGMRKYQSRFGTAISNLGDINLDGYNDIAVGAPYEEDLRGAVYIFNGQSGALGSMYSQRIPASSVDMRLKGFGYYISRKSIDVDGNQYPDLSVGAYLTDSAVLLRTRPLVSLDNLDFTVSPSVIPLNSSGLECSTPTDYNPCVTLTICFRFSGVGVANVLPFDFTIGADIGRTQNKKSSRVQLYYNGENMGNTFSKEGLPVPKGDRTCEKIYARVQSVGREFFSAISEKLTFHAANRLGQTLAPGTLEPLLRQTQYPNKTVEAAFETGCGSSVCKSDLTLAMEISNTEIVLGETKEILAEVRVRNKGEPSFDASVLFQTSDNTVFTGYSVLLDQGSERLTCNPSKTKDNKTSVRCSFDQPVFQLQFGLFRVRFDVSRDVLFAGSIKSIQKSVEITATAETNGEINGADNTVTKISRVTLKGGLQITGSSNPEQARFTVEKKTFFNFVQIYSVYNQGPSDIPQALVHFEIPVRSQSVQMVDNSRLRISVGSDAGDRCSITRFPGGLAQMTSTTTSPSTTTTMKPPSTKTTTIRPLPGSSTSSPDAIPRRKKREVKGPSLQSNSNKFQSINCSSGSNYDCALIVCSIRNIYYQEDRLFTFTINISETVLPAVEQGATFLRYVTHGAVYPPLTSDIPIISFKNSTTTVSVDIFPQVIVQQIQELNIWIIIGGCIGGLVLFIILGLILYKCGFFKREKKKQIDAYKRQSLAFKRQSRATMRGPKSPEEKAIFSETPSN